MFKIVVLGAGGVGKSALTLRFVRDVFSDGYDPTIEENYTRSLTVDGITSMLDVFDTAGMDQFVSINDMYYKAGDGFLLVFSLTNRYTLREVEMVRQQLMQVKPTAPVVIVGNKMDLVNEREVDASMISDLASRWKVSVFETSAKRDWHVTDAFEELVRQVRLQNPQVAKKRRRRPRPVCLVM